MRVLITAGGTREPLDGVRVLANTSTGATGAALAEGFYRAGWATTLLRAEAARLPAAPVEQRTFATVDELDTACQVLLSAHDYALVIHAAAVSDFTLAAVTIDGIRHPAPLTGKLPSDRALLLELVPGKKILPALKGYSRNPDLRLIGFKLTDGATAAEISVAVNRVLAAGADLVVQNDLTTMATCRATLWNRSGPGVKARDEAALVAALIGYAKALC